MLQNSQESDDEFAKEVLKKINFRAVLFQRLNWGMCTFAGIFYYSYPLTSGSRNHPIAVWLFGLDPKAYPTYEITFAFELFITMVDGATYVIFVNKFISFMLFGFCLLQILHHNFDQITEGSVDVSSPNNALIAKRLRLFIEKHTRIIHYVGGMNEIFSTVFMMDLIIYGQLLCVLLFMLVIVEQISQIVLVLSLLFLIFIQLFIICWIANELLKQVC